MAGAGGVLSAECGVEGDDGWSQWNKRREGESNG